MMFRVNCQRFAVAFHHTSLLPDAHSIRLRLCSGVAHLAIVLGAGIIVQVDVGVNLGNCGQDCVVLRLGIHTRHVSRVGFDDALEGVLGRPLPALSRGRPAE